MSSSAQNGCPTPSGVGARLQIQNRAPTAKAVGHPTLIAFLFAAFVFYPSSFILAASLRTLDGKTYQGQITLESSGQISVVDPRAEKPIKVELSNVLEANFGGDAPKPRPAAARTQVAGQLPAPWETLDIGNLAEKSSAKIATENAETFSIKSAGAKVGGATDAFCFVAQSVTGDADLVAHFLTASDPRQVAQGLMIRSGLQANAAYVGLFLAGNELRFLKRPRTGDATEGGAVGEARVSLPLWMRLTRQGDTVIASISRDGKNWKPLATDAFAIDGQDAALAGIAVAGRGTQLAGGHVTGIRLSGSATNNAAAASADPAPIATPVASSVKEGVMLRSGTLLAGAQIESADNGTLRFSRAGQRGETVSLVNVARVIFKELSPEAVAKIPPQRTGVLLKEGDFVEGDFKSFQYGRLTLSSLIFGLQRFDVREKAVALVLSDLETARAQMVLRTHDGSVYMAKSVAPDKDRLVVQDPVAGEFSISVRDVAQISAGAGRFASLADIKPQAAFGLSLDSTGAGLPMNLGGIPCERGLTISAGSSATWNLAGAYRTLTFKCGVPRGVLPTAPVRFIVLSDGKELYKSPPRTSQDEPLAASVSVGDAKSLTLKVESTLSPALPTPGLWGDVALVK